MKTLFIDVDGTLLDSLPGIQASFHYALDELSWPYPDQAFNKSIAGPPMEHTFTALGMDPETRALAMKHYMRHHGNIGWAMSNPYPGVQELLWRLKDEGFRLCTATAKTKEFAEKALSLHDLLRPFNFIGGATTLDVRHPRRGKKAVIAHVLNSLQLKGQESDILMVGDRVHDITGAAAFHIPTAAVTWGYGSPEEYQQARFVAETIDELERIIHAWAKP